MFSRGSRRPSPPTGRRSSPSSRRLLQRGRAGRHRVSDQAVQSSWNVGAGASAKATLDCVTAWYTDFRKDLSRIDVPTLVIHGDADRIVPIAATGLRTHESVSGSRLLVIEGGPHGVIWTHADQVNRALLDFLKGRAVGTAEASREVFRAPSRTAISKFLPASENGPRLQRAGRLRERQ